MPSSKLPPIKGKKWEWLLEGKRDANMFRDKLNTSFYSTVMVVSPEKLLVLNVLQNSVTIKLAEQFEHATANRNEESCAEETHFEEVGGGEKYAHNI